VQEVLSFRARVANNKCRYLIAVADNFPKVDIRRGAIA
jgi:hypothetical protein